MKRFLVLLVVCWNLSCFANVDIEDITYNTLSISGQGSIKVRATIADIVMGIETMGDTPSEALESLAARQKEVLEVIRQHAVDDLETQSFSLYPRYDKDNTVRVIGYVARSGISFSVPVDRAGEMIDMAIKAGANENQSLSVRATDAEMREAQAKALSIAGQSALDTGKGLLKTLGLSFRSIRRVEVPTYQSGPYYRNTAMKFQGEAVPTLEVTEQMLTVSVTVDLLLEYVREKG